MSENTSNIVRPAAHGLLLSVLMIAATAASGVPEAEPVSIRQTITAIYIPLADHYAGIVAYEKYRHAMRYADYRIEQMKSWPLLRARFMSGEVDMAYIMSPQAMDMFRAEPNFRWVSLMHRDGSALAINDLLNRHVNLPEKRADRHPDDKVARAFAMAKQQSGRPTQCGVPHLQSTHTVVLYKYLKDHGMTLGLDGGVNKDVMAIEVAPSASPSFIKAKNSRAIPASFEQSLPWADVVETQGFGHVAWYSKDVIQWPPYGHVECIAIATDTSIRQKHAALKEVIGYIHQAGLDIEKARLTGGKAMADIADMVRKHIPEHNERAIVQSLRPDLNVINYRELNIDKGGLQQIMDLAVAGGILKEPINIDEFADTGFSTQTTSWNESKELLALARASTEITDGTRLRLDAIGEIVAGLAADPVILEATRQQNAKDTPLARIMTIDRRWVSGGQIELADDLQNNPAGRILRQTIMSDQDLYTEAFLCDRLGAVVAEYPRTSDYWQGDEEKFTMAYNGGNGQVFVDALEFDESTMSYSIHISYPVMDQGDTIGVLVLGIRNIE